MKHELEMLPAELLWEDDGHLTEVALGAIADGEDALVSPKAVLHLDDCDRCLSALGVMARRAEIVAEVVASSAQHEAPASLVAVSGKRAAMRSPRFAIASGLVVAVLGALPILARFPSFVSLVTFVFTRGLPVLMHMAAELWVSVDSRVAGLLPLAAALVLVVTGTMVARALPRISMDVERQGASA